MPDSRLWLKITLDVLDNPKMIGLSDAAIRCWLEALCYSRTQLTDGFISDGVAAAKRWHPDVIEELCNNHPVRPSWKRTTDTHGRPGYQIHDYAEHQDTAAVVRARRERNTVNGAKGGAARAARAAARAVEASTTMAGAAVANGLTNMPAIIAAITQHTGRDTSHDRAVAIALGVLARAPTQPKSAQSYVLASIKKHPDEVRADLDAIERQE